MTPMLRPWMLQPHNYSQAIGPNHYKVAYGRTGTYKGMGRLGDVTTAAPGYAVGSVQDQIATCVEAGGPIGDCVSAVLGGTTATGGTSTILPWVAFGAVLLLLLGGRR